MNIDAVERAFHKNFAEYGELGASVSIWINGVEVLNLADGWCDKKYSQQWDSSTIVPFYSATKALSSATLLMLLEENGLSPNDLVCRVWANFPNSSATFSELLSHQCGLAALDRSVDMFNYEAVIEAIEAQVPNWNLGDGHGYHPRTFGYLLDHSVRILAGKKLGQVFSERIAKPLGLELWIGLPEAQFDRVATLYPGKMNKESLKDDFYNEFNRSGTLVRRAFSSPRGLQGVQEMNTPAAWQAGLPAMGGVGTAQGLAKFYQAAIGALPFFSEDVLGWISTPVITGNDKILRTITCFSCGFQFDPVDVDGKKIRYNYGKGIKAFGHPGAGGSHAFGDPTAGMSYAYTMNQMDLSVLPGFKSEEILKALC